jgi:hypothetical protein
MSGILRHELAADVNKLGNKHLRVPVHAGVGEVDCQLTLLLVEAEAEGC